VRRLVEAELALKLGDEFRVEPLRAAIAAAGIELPPPDPVRKGPAAAGKALGGADIEPEAGR
jgi:hypothetical protein